MADTGLNILGFRLDDIQMSDTLQEKIANHLIELVRSHKELAKYNFRNNYIPDCVVMKMLNEVKENKVIFILDLPECIAHELKELYVEIIKKRKPKKKKKKAKKSKK